MLLKVPLLLPYLSCIDEFEFSWFSNSKQLSVIRYSILKIEMLFEFQSKTNIEIIAF